MIIILLLKVFEKNLTFLWKELVNKKIMQILKGAGI
jgi:hypothetical protein